MGTGTPVHEPSAACRQEWQTPLAAMRTRTSPTRGVSSSTSSTFSGVRCSNSTEARMWSSSRDYRNGGPDMAPKPPNARSAPAEPWRSSSGAPRLVTYSRIEVRVQEIHGEVHGHEHDGHEQDRALGQRIIALVDRPQHQTSDARQRENLLDDDGAAEQDADLQPDHGDDRDQRVAQRVLEHDQAGSQPLGRRRADVLG